MTKRVAPIVALLAVLVFAAPTSASTKQANRYVLKHPKHEHCRAHYVKKVETVKKREHRRTVKLRETMCVYVKPEPAAMTPAPTPTAPAPTVSLKARLDSFEQSPANPFAVTYIYSASATETLGSVSKPVPTLPQGVLNLYADGLLACSINVGGSTTGGECPVHESMGTHTIIVTYTSGSASATETSVEQIKPFPLASTTTTLTLTPAGCETVETRRGELVWENDEHLPENGTEHRCSYLAEAGSTGVEGQTVTITVGSLSLELASNPESCEIIVGSWKSTGLLEQIGWSTTGCSGSMSKYELSEIGHEHPPTEWTVVAHGEGNPGFGEGGGGWLASESAPQTATS